MADASTYNLHIIIRFELELALFSGDLKAEDAEEAWADAYERTLRIRPEKASTGVLQDMHWASAYFGYFPSYTIGNLYSASCKVVMEEDIPDMWTQVEAGNFQEILSWLNTKIHSQGHLKSQEEIIADAVGSRDHVQDLITHLRSRHQQIQSLL